MKIFRPLILSVFAMLALSSCGVLKCDRCAAKQAAARERALQEYQASQNAAAVTPPAGAPATTPVPVPAPALANQ